MDCIYCKKVALYAGSLMLKNGAETFRVEEIMKYIMQASGYEEVDAFVTPTGIFLSIGDDSSSGTYIKRISERSINLSKIDKVNTVSRKLCAGEISIEKAYFLFKQIDLEPPYRLIVKLLASALTAAFFSLLFKGSFPEFTATFTVNILMQLILSLLNKYNISFFLTNLSGGAISAFLSILIMKMGFPIDSNIVIISSIMTLVPGVAITNSIRDTFHGDLLSGVARMAEAVFIAMAIAGGVGIVLNFTF
jgi:uncharacterized membrane protein YjjP (DUF1212 family)